MEDKVDVTIIIPSRNEKFLQKTILDVLNKATGNIEVLPVLDGYEPPADEIVIDPRVNYIRLPQNYYTQKRHGINYAVSIAKGDHIMSLDAHCMMAPGFDEVLKRDCQEDWIVIPRRHRLDAKNWTLQKQSDSRPPIDYEYTMYPLNFKFPSFHGYKWDARTLERQDIMLDDTMIFQGSCWFMHKDWFKKMGFMQIEGYSGWGQEAEELSFTTWCMGGRVVTDKNTWYAHLHKGKEYGRMYFMDKNWVNKCDKFCYDFWTNNKLKDRIHDFEWIIDKFWPLPGWKTKYPWKL